MNSMQDRSKFPKLLAQTFSGITLVYILFGLCGYMAFGEETKDIVTLNLPRNWSSLTVQVAKNYILLAFMFYSYFYLTWLLVFLQLNNHYTALFFCFIFS